MVVKREITREQLLETNEVHRKNKDKNVERQLVALELYSNGESRGEIAKQTGYAPTYIAQIVRRFTTEGLTKIAGNNYRDNRRNLSFEEEREFSEAFENEEKSGQPTTVRKIQKAYEELIGRKLKSKSQIYEFLKRHDFRKIILRREHLIALKYHFLLNVEDYKVRYKKRAHL